jgi:hypothetical protein
MVLPGPSRMNQYFIKSSNNLSFVQIRPDGHPSLASGGRHACIGAESVASRLYLLAGFAMKAKGANPCDTIRSTSTGMSGPLSLSPAFRSPAGGFEFRAVSIKFQ